MAARHMFDLPSFAPIIPRNDNEIIEIIETVVVIIFSGDISAINNGNIAPIANVKAEAPAA